MSQRTALLGLMVALGLTVGQAPSARAQLFSDDEARRAILDLRAQFEALKSSQADQAQRLEAITTGQLGLLQRIEELRNEIAQIRGGVEEALQSGKTNEAQQKELFTSLETSLKKLEKRLVKLEPQTLSLEGEAVLVSYDERLAFEKAREEMANGQLATAAEAFAQLATQKDANLYPWARYYEGILRYSLKDYTASARALDAFIDSAPKHPRAADGMLTQAAAQAEAGQLKSARATLARITQRFPGSEQAKTAQARLKALPKPGK